MYTFLDNNKISPLENVLSNLVFIMDDVITEKEKVMKHYFSRGIHYKINILYFVQSYSKVTKQLIHDNDNLILLFK